MSIINNSIKQTMNWISKRTGQLATIKQERGLVRHIEWNDVQLLFEVADNNANGLYKLLDILEEFYASHVNLSEEVDDNHTSFVEYTIAASTRFNTIETNIKKGLVVSETEPTAYVAGTVWAQIIP